MLLHCALPHTPQCPKSSPPLTLLLLLLPLCTPLTTLQCFVYTLLSLAVAGCSAASLTCHTCFMSLVANAPRSPLLNFFFFFFCLPPALRQLQFLQHQMQQQQMAMGTAAPQGGVPQQHTASQPRSKRKRSMPQPLPKS